MLRSNSKQSKFKIGEYLAKCHVVNPEEEEGKAAVGRICRKGRF